MELWGGPRATDKAENAARGAAAAAPSTPTTTAPCGPRTPRREWLVRLVGGTAGGTWPCSRLAASAPRRPRRPAARPPPTTAGCGWRREVLGRAAGRTWRLSGGGVGGWGGEAPGCFVCGCRAAVFEVGRYCLFRPEVTSVRWTLLLLFLCLPAKSCPLPSSPVGRLRRS